MSKFNETRFDGAKNKIIVRNLQYGLVSKYIKSNAIIVCGPSVSRNICDGRKIARTPKSKIFLIEQSPTIFKIVQRRFGKLSDKQKKNVYIIKGDVSNYETLINLKVPCRFEDLDLCIALNSIKYTILHRLSMQSKISAQKNFNKCIMFTSCMRSAKITSIMHTLNYIVNFLGAEIDLKNFGNAEKRIMSLYAPLMIKKGRLVDFRITTYKDGASMMSCLLIYK